MIIKEYRELNKIHHMDLIRGYNDAMKERDVGHGRIVTVTYVISDGIYLKIGKAGCGYKPNQSHISIRVSGLQTGNPRKLILLYLFDSDIEGELQWRFREYAKRGEWFYCKPEIIEFCKENCDVDMYEYFSKKKNFHVLGGLNG